VDALCPLVDVAGQNDQVAVDGGDGRTPSHFEVKVT
jgi:hypothetical protein